MLSRLLFAACLGLGLSGQAFSALSGLSEEELGEVHGADIGLVLNDISLSSEIIAGDVGRITTDGRDVFGSTLTWDHIYITGDCGTCSPHSVAAGNGAVFGSATDPIILDFASQTRLGLDDYLTPTTGLTTTLGTASLKFPNNSSVPANIGFLATFNIPANGDTPAALRNDEVWIEINGLELDQSEVHLWSVPGIGLATALRFNLHVDSVRQTFARDVNKYLGYIDGPGSFAGGMGYGSIDLDMRIGNLFYQPLQIYNQDVTLYNPSGADLHTQNFTLELMPIPNIPVIYNDFYSQPLSNINLSGGYIGAQPLGSSHVHGLQVHYLKITTRDL